MMSRRWITSRNGGGLAMPARKKAFRCFLLHKIVLTLERTRQQHLQYYDVTLLYSPLI
jgi:hypothetical protein